MATRHYAYRALAAPNKSLLNSTLRLNASPQSIAWRIVGFTGHTLRLVNVANRTEHIAHWADIFESLETERLVMED